MCHQDRVRRLHESDGIVCTEQGTQICATKAAATHHGLVRSAARWHCRFFRCDSSKCFVFIGTSECQNPYQARANELPEPATLGASTSSSVSFLGEWEYKMSVCVSRRVWNVCAHRARWWCYSLNDNNIVRIARSWRIHRVAQVQQSSLSASFLLEDVLEPLIKFTSSQLILVPTKSTHACTVPVYQWQCCLCYSQYTLILSFYFMPST